MTNEERDEPGPPPPDPLRRRLLRLGTMTFLTAGLGRHVKAEEESTCGVLTPHGWHTEDSACWLAMSSPPDLDCAKSQPGGGVYEDNDCMQGRDDQDCALPSSGVHAGRHKDHMCAIPGPGGDLTPDGDCAAATAHGTHKDDYCGTIVSLHPKTFAGDGDCGNVNETGTGFHSDLDCGKHIGSGVPGPDNDCTLQGHTDSLPPHQ